jgi:hypothetical protein
VEAGITPGEVSAEEHEARLQELQVGIEQRQSVVEQQEQIADEREIRLNKLEQHLDARARTVGISTATTQRRVQETIERGRAAGGEPRIPGPQQGRLEAH